VKKITLFLQEMNPVHFMIMAVSIGLGIGAALGNILVGLLLGVVLAVGPRFYVTLQRNKRTEMMENQLMDALILMGNVLKSGLDMSAAIEMVSTNMKPPISEEFKQVLNAYQLGTPLETALLDMTKRVPSPLVETVIYVINIQRETGGNIMKTFDQLISTIREEGRLQAKLRSYTAQGKMQILFLAFFPWGLGIFFYFTSPEFMQPALNHWVGKVLIALCIAWEVVGVFVTRRLIQVKV